MNLTKERIRELKDIIEYIQAQAESIYELTYDALSEVKFLMDELEETNGSNTTGSTEDSGRHTS